MAQYEEASPICRGKNLSWETVLLFFNNMPRDPMPKAQFHNYVESKINGWRQTHSQIARQLAFYYEDGDMCYPRFTGTTSYGELFAYMQNWATKYFIPNPFTPSLKGKEPTNIYQFLCNKIVDGKDNFDDVFDSIFDIKLSSHDKVIVYLSNFTDIEIDSGHLMKISGRTTHFDSELHPNLTLAVDSKKYYHYFDILEDDGHDNVSVYNFVQPLQQIFYGAPGTGKSNTIKCEVDQKNLPRVRTTFHPDSDYSTFVGAYKPTSVEVPVMTIIGKEQIPVVNASPEKKIVYEFVPQAFLKAYTGAWKNQEKPFFLIIEEINRGNCAQIFGDLFQLLDRNDETGLSDYPISPDEDIQKFLLTDKKYGFAALTEEQKAAIPSEVLSGELMILPKNLHIWATMNTSDQSLFPIDSAFKRRWDWQYMPISDGKKGWQIKANGKRYDWWQFLQKMNDKIGSTTNSEDKKLGYFFCKAKNGIIDAETFVGKVVFYIWNDVFKDFAEEAGDLFKDSSDSQDPLLSFNKFYTVGMDGKAKIVEEKVGMFLQNLGVDEVGEFDSDGEEVIGDSEIESDSRRILNVEFEDETIAIKRFPQYLQVLQKIGLDKAEIVASEKQVSVLGCALVTKDKDDTIEESQFSYVEVDGYFVVKGIKGKVMLNFLPLISDKYNLNLKIAYK